MRNRIQHIVTNGGASKTGRVGTCNECVQDHSANRIHTYGRPAAGMLHRRSIGLSWNGASSRTKGAGTHILTAGYNNLSLRVLSERGSVFPAGGSAIGKRAPFTVT